MQHYIDSAIIHISLKQNVYLCPAPKKAPSNNLQEKAWIQSEKTLNYFYSYLYFDFLAGLLKM